MQSLDFTGFVVAAVSTAALSSLLGIKLAYWRIHGRDTAWSILDAIVLFPALLPAHPLAKVLQDLFGRWIALSEFWPIIATVIVSIPFAYLPARITFARIDRELSDASRDLGIFQRAFRIFLPAAWRTLILSCLLATARAFRGYAVELLAPLPAVLVVAIPSLAAAWLLAIELSHSRHKS
jgi:ABC-type molybdate transport system permease subunit